MVITFLTLMQEEVIEAVENQTEVVLQSPTGLIKWQSLPCEYAIQLKKMLSFGSTTATEGKQISAYKNRMIQTNI